MYKEYGVKGLRIPHVDGQKESLNKPKLFNSYTCLYKIWKQRRQIWDGSRNQKAHEFDLGFRSKGAFYYADKEPKVNKKEKTLIS